MSDRQQAAPQSASQSKYVAQASANSNATVNVTNQYTRAAKVEAPFLHPQPSMYYVPRPDEETRLLSVLSCTSYSHSILLHGMSGIGKTWVAIKVVQQLHEQKHFPGGILWGSLDNLEPHELLDYFLEALDSGWSRNRPAPNILTRDAFWNHLSQRTKRTLIVFDDIQHERQVAKLIPANIGHPPHCCVLLIGTNRLLLWGGEFKEYAIPIGGLNDQQASAVFQEYLNSDETQSRLYRKHLGEIARRLEYVPLLLVTAAQNIILNGKGFVPFVALTSSASSCGRMM